MFVIPILTNVLTGCSFFVAAAASSELAATMGDGPVYHKPQRRGHSAAQAVEGMDMLAHAAASAGPSSAGTMYLLDAHGLIFQMYYGVGPMTAPDGRPTNAAFGVTRALISLYDRGADYLIAALDRKEPTFREQIDPNYKAHRTPPPPDLLIQEPIIYQVMEGMRIPFLSQVGYEADDILATVATAAAARGLDVYLCTSDKDCRQLLSDRIKILQLRKKGEEEILDAAALERDWGIRPEQVVDYLALTGDASDNVPGVSGVGPKTAAKWLQQYGTLDNILKNIESLPGSPRLREALRQAAASSNLERSRRLVTLDRHVPIAWDWEGWRRREWDYPRLLEIFQELGFRTFAERVRREYAAHRPATPPAGPSVATGTASGGAATKAAPARRRKSAASDEQLPLFADAEDAPLPGDDWSYAGYRLVDTPAAFQHFLQQLRRQRRFACDLETRGLDPLSDPIVGYAFCWQPGEGYYLPVMAPPGAAILPAEKVLQSLQPIFEDPTIAKVNHNIKFDMMVLASNGVRLAGVAGDSMIAHYLLEPGARSHGLDELTERYLHHRNIPITALIGSGKKQKTLDQLPPPQVRDYAAEDADTAWRLTELLEQRLAAEELLPLYQQLEIPLIEVLAEMELTGISIDVPFLRRLGEEMDRQLARQEEEIYRLAGRRFNIASLRELQKVLFEELHLPVQRRTGIKNEPSTDQESLEKLAALGHELPKRLIEYRQLTKLKNTYVDVLPRLVHPRTGRIHTSFNQTAVETGRLSSSEPNLQNIPARTEQGAQLRKAFIPRRGWLLISADYSQIELRLLAHFSGDPALQQAFAEDRDIHAAVAAEIFHVPLAAVTKAQRAVAKTVNFGVIYGMSAAGLANRLSIPRDQAEAFIDAYFQRYPKVLDYQQRLLAEAHATGMVRTILGRKRFFNREAIRPDSDYRNRTTAEREAVNMPIQGSAADLLKRAMLGVHQQLKRHNYQARLLLTVHDELVLEAPPEEVRPVAALVRREMSQALPLSVPLKVDLAAGPNWLEVEEIGDE